VKVAFDLHTQRIAGAHEVLENYVDDMLVKDLHVSKGIDVKLETLQLDATFVGNILEADRGEIRKVGEGADGRELSDFEIDFYLPAGKLVSESFERKTDSARLAVSSGYRGPVD